MDYIFCGRLSEQAQRQLERGASKFEDISLGENRPTQLVKRYGNLYSEARLDAMDALDELPDMADADDLKVKLLLSIVVVSLVSAAFFTTDYKTSQISLSPLQVSVISPLSSHPFTSLGRFSPVLIGVGAQSTLGGHQIFARKICIKNQQNARILQDSCPKNYQNTGICIIFAGKIYKIPEFHMIFARKMPEFYVIIARKIFFPEF